MIDGGCPTCKWARLPDGYVGAAEVLTTTQGRSVWKPAAVTACDHESGTVEYTVDGERAVAAVLSARKGRWAPHDQAHIFGVHLSTDEGRQSKLLSRAVQRHGRRAAITAVHTLSGAKGAGIGRPYMTAVGWALRGRQPLCTTVHATQAALHTEMTRRLREALSGSLLLAAVFFPMCVMVYNSFLVPVCHLVWGKESPWSICWRSEWIEAGYPNLPY